MTSDEQEIRQLVSTWMAESKAGNTDAVLKLMSEDVVFLVPGRPPMKGRAAFAAASQSPAGKPRPKIDGESEIQEIKVLGDWAFMWTKLQVSVTSPGGEPITRAGHTLSILKKEQGRWVIARDANLLVQVSASPSDTAIM